MRRLLAAIIAGGHCSAGARRVIFESRDVPRKYLEAFAAERTLSISRTTRESTAVAFEASMIHPRLNGMLAHLRQAAGASSPDGPTDADLLARFASHRDHAAFELLVWRHGAMVLQTCRRLLARPEDAEDAFQATFLALVRRAKSIKRGQVVAGWLHTVACRVALRVRSATARRLEREQHAVAGKNGHEGALLDNGFDPIAWAEVRTLIDEELSRL